MKATLFVFGVISLLFCCSPTSAQTPSTKLTVSSSSVDFGDHDIGTETPAANPLILRNDGDAPVTISVTSSGPNSDDFLTDNTTCGDKLPAKGQCAIKVIFSPRMAIENLTGILSPNPVRKKTLEVKGGSETIQIQLSGRAFPNLGASPSIVELAIPRWSSAPAPVALSVTNYTDAQLESLAVTVTGNFTEDHSGCVKVKPGDSCVIYVTYPPKQSAAAEGSLAFSGTLAATPAPPENAAKETNPAPPKTSPSPAPRLTRGVVLHGSISSGWHWWRFDVSTWFLFAMAGLYFLTLVGVRWHMIAKPARAELVAEIRAIRARVASESAWLPESPQKKVQLYEINHLLDVALYPFRYPHFFDPGGPAAEETTRPYPRWRTRVFDALFWTRGSDLAGWTLAHEVERQLVQLLPLQPVWARLEIAEQELRVLNTPVTLALADRIHQSLTSGEALILERARALLQKAQSLFKPLSAPEAARLAWLADLRKRTSDFLLSLTDWISKNNTADADQAKRNSQLNDFSKLAENGGQLASEGSELEKYLADPDSSKQLLQEISAFFTDFAAAAQPIKQASGNSTIDQGTYNTLLGSLKNLGDRAKVLAEKLNLTPPEQAKPFKDLLALCKAQGALVADITKATTPSTGLSLLLDILKHLQDENDLVQHIDQADDASNIGKCREDVKKLAALTLLPSDQMKRIESALSDPVPETLGRWQALLAEALVLIDGGADDRFYETTGWHNKLMWLVVCGLLFLVGLGLVFENGVLLLVGAVGGLLSRLQRTIEKADPPTDYGTTWGALFLSPLTGALTAWGGILLIVLGAKLHIFGSALDLDSNDPYNPTALALALVFGFSERWFSGLIDTVQSKVVAPAGSTSTSTTTPAPTPPALKITSTDPKTASAAKENKVKLVGTNFQAGATVAVTDTAGTAIPTTVDPNHDATTMMVTFTPPNKGTVTMTVTNPDKQTIACKLDVT
ncbi:MAG: hypothetical protein JWQ49_6709 [Edaphobacter sp.]|nr:hypothetical protein [Edaphobacter sp.]